MQYQKSCSRVHFLKQLLHEILIIPKGTYYVLSFLDFNQIYVRDVTGFANWYVTIHRLGKCKKVRSLWKRAFVYEALHWKSWNGKKYSTNHKTWSPWNEKSLFKVWWPGVSIEKWQMLRWRTVPCALKAKALLKLFFCANSLLNVLETLKVKAYWQ